MAASPQREARRAAALIRPDGGRQAGLDPAGEGRRKEKLDGWRRGEYCALALDNCWPSIPSGPEGVMPKAFPVIDPESLLAQSQKATHAAKSRRRYVDIDVEFLC